MNVSTAKISNLTYAAGASRVSPEVRTAVLVWIISLLGTGIVALIVFSLGITLAD